MTTYDLRRTYSNWMEAAGILRTRRKLCMWHSAGDVTGGYELHEVSAFLAEDKRPHHIPHHPFTGCTTRAEA